jgi:hypothetical protein
MFAKSQPLDFENFLGYKHNSSILLLHSAKYYLYL